MIMTEKRAQDDETVRCLCGACFRRDPTAVPHRYIPAAPECWSCFGVVLAREYENPALFGAVHQLTVDAYAAQHPLGQPAKSLTAHLVSLYAILERGVSGPHTIKAFVDSRPAFPELPVPREFGPLTIADVAAARDAAEHGDLVRQWAAQVWTAWAPARAEIAALLEATGS